MGTGEPWGQPFDGRGHLRSGDDLFGQESGWLSR